MAIFLDIGIQGGSRLKGYARYFGGKIVWVLLTFFVAFLLNFILPRLMPGDPVAVITQRVAAGMQSQAGIQRVYEQYAELFGTNLPLSMQVSSFLPSSSPCSTLALKISPVEMCGMFSFLANKIACVPFPEA